MRALALVLVLASARVAVAADEKTAVATGEWSEVVDGLRGRLILARGEPRGATKTRDTKVYVELENSGITNSGQRNVYFDPDALECELRDADGKAVRQTPGAGNGGRPGKVWVTMPFDSALRLRANPFGFGSADADGLLVPLNNAAWFIKAGDTGEYALTGTLTVEPPAGHGKADVWKGALKLPGIKLPPIKERAPAKEPAAPRKDPLAALAGTWEVTSKVTDGKPAELKGLTPDERLKVVMNWVIEGRKVTIRVGTHAGSGYVIEGVDTSADPARIDLTVAGQGLPLTVEGQKHAAIYKVTGDVLTVCLAIDGPRPDAFTAEKGSGRQLLVFKRVETK